MSIYLNINCQTNFLEFRDYRGWATTNPNVNPNGIPTNITSFTPLVFKIDAYNGNTLVGTQQLNAVPIYSGMPPVPSHDFPILSYFTQPFTHITFELLQLTTGIKFIEKTVYYTCRAHSCLLGKILDAGCGCNSDSSEAMDLLLKLFAVENFPDCVEHEKILSIIQKAEELCGQ